MFSASFPTLRVLSPSSEDWGLEAVPFQPLEHNPDTDDDDDGDDQKTSYFISKGSEKGNNLLKITGGDFKKQDYQSLDLIAGLHIQSSGYVFIESLHPTQKVYLARDQPKQFIGEQKRLLPRSKPPNERVLVLLDFDAHIVINDKVVEFKIGSLNSIPQNSESRNLVKSMKAERDIAMGHDERDEDPHILVQQSFPQESLGRGDTDLAYLTPVAPGAIQEEPKVHETPSVKSRFMNPDSATVTLPKILLKEDTFNDLNGGDEGDEPTPSRSKSTPKQFVASVSLNSPMFSGHNSEGLSEVVVSQLSVMGDAAMSTSDEEEVVQSSKFFKSVPIEPNSIESTADEEMPASTRKATPMANVMNPINITSSPEGTYEEKENRGSEAEDMMKQFSEVPDHVRSAGESKRASPAVGRVDKDLNTPLKHMKQGVPEGFLYEEHKKETTPRQTYGKNKRAPRSKPKEKVEMDKITESAISDDELIQGAHGRSAGAGDRVEMKVRGTWSASSTGGNKNEEQEVRGENISPRQKRIIHADEEESITAKIAGDEEEEITPSRRTQGRGGRKTVQSQPSVIAAARSTRKRRRTSENAEDGQQPPGGEIELYSALAGTEESAIQIVKEPKPKRTKITLPKKSAARTPATKRGKKKDATTPSLPESSEEILGDTQYTFTDTTQTQTIDRVEVKAPVKTPKTTTGIAEKKTSLAAKKVGTVPSAKKVDFHRELAEEEGARDGQSKAEEIDGRKVRTKDRYEGDSPKIVFSNSGLDERKDIEKFLRTNGGKKMHNVSAPGVNFLVVGPGELKRTPKLTIGVALGKWVVEDQWLIDSKEVGYFLDPDRYIPHDPTHEKAWSFSLRTAIARGRTGENNVLKDHNIYITSSLLTQLKASKQEESLVEMLKAAGAGSIIKKAPKSKKEDGENSGKTLILGTEKGDGDASTLENLGWSVYGTGIVAISVLRGRLEVGGNEFKILAEKGGSQKVGRAKKGK